MTIDSAPADSSAEASRSPAPPSWAWRQAALFLVGAAQLITISALVSAEPIPATWSSLLLAVAPAPLAAAAAFAPAPVNLLAAVAGIAVVRFVCEPYGALGDSRRGSRTGGAARG